MLATLIAPALQADERWRLENDVGSDQFLWLASATVSITHRLDCEVQRHINDQSVGEGCQHAPARVQVT